MQALISNGRAAIGGAACEGPEVAWAAACCALHGVPPLIIAKGAIAAELAYTPLYALHQKRLHRSATAARAICTPTPP